MIPPDPSPIDADAWFGRYFCGCGNGNPDVVLADYLAMFAPSGRDERSDEDRKIGVQDRRQHPIGPRAAGAFAAEHGNDVLHLLGYLLDGAGIIEHGGSVISSAWLTPLGIEVKERVEAGDFGGTSA